ncbi:MAG: NAD-dependent epimerase/dehydratase family protein, partial [Pseudomonadota bacterium]
MRVLVTGAGGFLGRHVAAALRARGDSVRGLDIAEMPAGIEGVRGSVTDPAAVGEAMAGTDAVIHAAAIAHLWARYPAAYTAVNVEGTRSVLAAAAGRPVLHVSSYVTLIGGSPAEPPAPLTEEDRLPEAEMLGSYPLSKHRAEALAEEAGAIVVLPSAPIGPGDLNLTPPGRMLADAAAGRLPAVLDCLMNVVDAESVAAGLLAALDRGRPGRRYLLTGEDVAMPELAARIAAAAGVRPPRGRVPGWLALTAAQVE